VAPRVTLREAVGVEALDLGQQLIALVLAAEPGGS
jgi:hypothetical protein